MYGLGELESAIMDVLWSTNDAFKVRDVLERINTRRRQLAYTTVMSVLDNLHRKQWVQRELDGKAFRYWPAMSREEAASRALRNILDTSGDAEAVLIHFAESISAEEKEALRKGMRRRARRR